MKKINYKKGEEIELTMMKNKKGRRPVSRCEDGRICIIDRDCKGFYPLDSTWMCKILSVEERKLIVAPLYETISPATNHMEFAEKSKILSKKFSKEVF